MKSSKKILGASAALGLAIALSAGSTFAWFSAGNTKVGVDSFDLSATTETNGANLDVAITTIGATSNPGDSEYKSLVTFGGGQLDSLKTIPLKPLTYVLTGENKGFNNEKGVVTANNPSNDTGYITFRLVFRSTAAMDIYLNTDSAVSPVALKGEEEEGEEPSTLELKTFSFKDSEVGKKFGDRIINTSAGYGGSTGVDFTNDADSTDRTFTVRARAANAARVMFEEKNAGEAKKIWSPNEYYVSGKQAEFGVTDGNNFDENDNKIESGFCYGNLASDFNYLKGAALAAGGNPTLIAALDPANNETDSGAKYVKQADYTSLALTKGESGTKIATTTNVKADWVGGSYITSSTDYFAVVDVTFWLEGTDGDCIDSILGDKMSVLLNFKGVEKTA